MRTYVQAYGAHHGYRLYACTYERRNHGVFTTFEGGTDTMAAPQYAIMPENAALEMANETLTAELKESRQESVLKRMADLQLRHDYDAAVSILERIPPEVLEAYAPDNRGNRSKTKGRGEDVRE